MEESLSDLPVLLSIVSRLSDLIAKIRLRSIYDLHAPQSRKRLQVYADRLAKLAAPQRVVA